jgi:hypothetical protein
MSDEKDPKPATTKTPSTAPEKKKDTATSHWGKTPASEKKPVEKKPAK